MNEGGFFVQLALSAAAVGGAGRDRGLGQDRPARPGRWTSHRARALLAEEFPGRKVDAIWIASDGWAGRWPSPAGLAPGHLPGRRRLRLPPDPLAPGGGGGPSRTGRLRVEPGRCVAAADGDHRAGRPGRPKDLALVIKPAFRTGHPGPRPSSSSTVHPGDRAGPVSRKADARYETKDTAVVAAHWALGSSVAGRADRRP